MEPARVTIACAGCKKRFFEEGFKVNRLGARLKTCLECNERDKARRARAPDKSKVYEAFVTGLTNLGLSVDALERDFIYIGGNRNSHANYFRLKCPNDVRPPQAHYCVCGHAIVENCYMRNPITQNTLTLGSCCIRRFLPNAGRTCAECGGSHRNRKDDLCNLCRLPKCAKCQDRFKPIYRGQSECEGCYSRRYQAPRKPAGATKADVEVNSVTLTPPPPPEPKILTPVHEPPPEQPQPVQLRVPTKHSRQEVHYVGGYRCEECYDILRNTEAALCASCKAREWSQARSNST